MTKYKLRPLESINEIILHCSATPAKMDIGAKEIRQWHVRGNGWIDIGYHFIIRRNGVIEEGRPLQAIGAHCSNHNARSIGICLVGGTKGDAKTPENNFTPEQFKACAELIKRLERRLPGIQSIVGHNRYANKACPVFDVTEFKNNYLEGGDGD